MKKSEKIITACLTILLGVLLITLKGNFISILMTLVGVGLIVLGIVDFVYRTIPSAIIKLVSGIFIIVCGWLLVSAVLYIVAAILQILGFLLFYYKLEHKVRGYTPFYTFCEYIVPIIYLIIGGLLLFNQTGALNVILVVCGILTIAQGGLFLFNALTSK